jgi:peptidoglycan/xylan/chitin deacetylase (PgdA/CDA1 family)
MYHGVSEISERGKKIRSVNPAYSLTANQFREQMEYLHTNRYITLSLDQLLNNESVPQKSLVITFDDGWADNYTNVFPTLKEYSLTATIFVISGFIGKAKYMDWHQLREMNAAGLSIQSHTVSHKPLAQLSKTEVEYELVTSKKTIENALGKKVNFLSLPHGVFNRRVLETAHEAGYLAICTSEPGFSHEHMDIPVLKRINISDHYHLQTFKKIIEKNRMTILPLIFSKKLKNLLKRTIGSGNYRKIYNLRYTARD